MAGISLEQAEAQLAAWIEASTKVASGQSYEIAGRKLTRVDADQIREMVTFWDDKVKELTAGGGRRRRTYTLVPR